MSDIKEKTLRLIDGLKATCQSYGMGNDGNEYKIITQVFLYKFLNDKFGYELKNAKAILDECHTKFFFRLSSKAKSVIEASISFDSSLIISINLSPSF